jgi:DNA-binding winged helix-turn-helix (wHTH) protein
MKYTFANYSFDELTQSLQRPDGSTSRLRPKVSSLLAIFLNRPSNELISKEELIRALWGENAEADDHDLQRLKNELAGKLGNELLIESVPRKGYIFTAQPNPTSRSAERNGDVAVDLRRAADNPSPLHIFPGKGGTPAGTVFVHSYVGYGANDFVEHVAQRVPWEEVRRHMAMLSPNLPSTLVIPFNHSVNKSTKQESWWVVCLPTNVNQVSGAWEFVDLTRYKSMVFEGRSTLPESAKNERVPVLVRLEDNSAEATDGKRQSTNWHSKTLLLPESFLRFELPLNDFKWSVDAWVGNTKPVNRNRVAQITFGHNATVATTAGTIEIRNIMFLA